MIAPSSQVSTSFTQLYPDVDPLKAQPLSIFERIMCAAGTAILSFGCVMGDVIAAGIGLALLFFAIYTASHQTSRRIRREARDRFPHIGWAEDRAIPRQKLFFLLVIFWVIIVGINLAAFWFATENTRMFVAVIAAVLTFFLVMFMPGLSPVWSRQVAPVHPEAREPELLDKQPTAGTQLPVKKFMSHDQTSVFDRVETDPR